MKALDSLVLHAPSMTQIGSPRPALDKALQQALREWKDLRKLPARHRSPSEGETQYHYSQWRYQHE
jgi:hypothetical protein